MCLPALKRRGDRTRALRNDVVGTPQGIPPGERYTPREMGGKPENPDTTECPPLLTPREVWAGSQRVHPSYGARAGRCKSARARPVKSVVAKTKKPNRWLTKQAGGILPRC
jgi:hypothetical protein